MALGNFDRFGTMLHRYATFTPMWVSKQTIDDLLLAGMTPISHLSLAERYAVRQELVPVFTDGVRSIVDRETWSKVADTIRKLGGY